MGLMDRVKAQASQLAQQAMDATQEGKARLDQAQAGRRGDAMLRQLGALVLAERTGRGGPDTQAKINQLVNDISAHEQANGLNLTADPGSAFQGGGSSPFQGGQAQGGQAPYQGGQPQAGQAPYGGGQAEGGQDPFQSAGPPTADQGGDPDAYQGPTTIHQGPFFTAPSEGEDPGSQAAPQ
jgi:hypothetical protein